MAARRPWGMLFVMPFHRAGRLGPEDLLATSAQARSYLWSVLLTFPAWVVFLVSALSGGDGVSGVAVRHLRAPGNYWRS